MEIQDVKYETTGHFNNSVIGIWDNPKYWGCEKGDMASVIVITKVNKETEKVVSRTIEFD